MKRRRLLMVLSSAAICAALGGTVFNTTNTYANPIIHNVRLANNVENESTTNYIRRVPNSWANKTIEYQGLSYNVSSDKKMTASIASNPESVTELFLYASLGNGLVTYNEIDWTRYTALQDVVVVANDISKFVPILSTLPKGTNLYISGDLAIGEALGTMPFENLYICNTYVQTHSSITSTDFTSKLASSKLKEIYYNDFYKSYASSSITSFVSKRYTNLQGEEIALYGYFDEDLKYPKQVFYPCDDFTLEGKYFGGEVRYTAGTSEITSKNQFTQSLASLDERVIDFNGEGYTASSFFSSVQNEFGTLYLPNIISYGARNVKAKEVVFPTINNKSIDILAFSEVEAIRFLPADNSVIKVGTALYDSASSKLKKIYLPEGKEDFFYNLTSRSDLSPLIEYYDASKYVAPLNSFKNNDETIYVKNGNLSIEQALNQVSRLKALGITYDGRPVDEITKLYELPQLDEYNYDDYSLRDMETLLLGKDMDITKVLGLLKDYMILNHNATCDPKDFNLGSIQTSNIDENGEGTVTFNVQFPDKTTQEVALNVKRLTFTSSCAYLLDEAKNITVLTNLTTSKNNLASLVTPLMENYLSETQVEYQVSEILDTTTATFNCGNTYKAAGSSGKIRVIALSDKFTLSSPGTEETPDTPKEDTNGVDTEGYVMKEIKHIYTTNTIDAKNLFINIDMDLLTYNGQKRQFLPAIGYNKHDNTKDYQIGISGKIAEKDNYFKNIDVSIIKNSLNLGIIVFEDGSITIEYYGADNYTKEELIAGIEEFLVSQNIDSTGVTINGTILTNGEYKGSYSGGELTVINSNYNIKYSSETKPVDQSSVKKGYVVTTKIYYTKGYLKEDALRAVSRNILLHDGERVTDYDIEFKTRENSNFVDYLIKVNGEELKGYVELIEVETNYKYIFARAFDFDTAYIFIDKLDASPEYTLNDVMKDVIFQFRTIFGEFKDDTNVNFTKNQEVNLEGVYQIGNGSFWGYDYKVEVNSLDHVVKTNKVTVDGKEAMGETFKEKFENFFDNLKAKYEENNVFRILTITLGSVFGLLLIYGAYKLLKKIFKWFSK